MPYLHRLMANVVPPYRRRGIYRACLLCSLFPAHARGPPLHRACLLWRYSPHTRADPSRAARGAHSNSPHGWDAGGHQARAFGIEGATAKTQLSFLFFGEGFVDLFHCTFVFCRTDAFCLNKNKFVRPRILGIWTFCSMSNLLNKIFPGIHEIH